MKCDFNVRENNRKRKGFPPQLHVLRRWRSESGRKFFVCWLLPLIYPHLNSRLAFPYRKRASPQGQQSGCGGAIALHSSWTGEIQALRWDCEKTGANSGGSRSICVSFNSLPVRPSTLCFACRAMWHDAWDMNLRDGVTIKYPNCTNSTTSWCKCLCGS